MSKKNIKEILCENCKMNCKHLANNSLVFNCFFNHNDADALLRAWNFCESQYKSEIEELKVKFSEATKTYTDDIDRLEKETAELKKKHNKEVSSQQEKIQSLKSELEQVKKENQELRESFFSYLRRTM